MDRPFVGQDQHRYDAAFSRILPYLKRSDDDLHAFFERMQYPKSKVCWTEYWTQLAIVKNIESFARPRQIALIIPDKDKYFDTPYNAVTYDDGSTYVITYDFRTDFVAIGFPDMLMIDFDFDVRESDNTQEYAKLFAQSIELLNRASGVWKQGNPDTPLKWSLFKTDKGMHAFLVSHKADYRDMKWIHFMLMFDADPWYTAFASVFGWMIRLNRKKGRPHDFVCDIVSTDFLSRVCNEFHLDATNFVTFVQEADGGIVPHSTTDILDDIAWKLRFKFMCTKYFLTNDASFVKCALTPLVLYMNRPYAESRSEHSPPNKELLHEDTRHRLEDMRAALHDMERRAKQHTPTPTSPRSVWKALSRVTLLPTHTLDTDAKP